MKLALCDNKSRLWHWVHSDVVEIFFGTVLVLNVLVIGVQVEVELRASQGHWLLHVCYGLRSVFLVTFLIELIIRCSADRLEFFYKSQRKPREETCEQRFFAVLSGIRFEGFFDVALNLVTIVELWVVTPLTSATDGSDVLQDPMRAASSLRILQLARLASVVRVLHVSRDLTLLVLGLVKSLKSICGVFLIILIFAYVGALICSVDLGCSQHEELQESFGSVFAGMYTHFKLCTLDGWATLCHYATHENPLWAVYFVTFIAITNLALVNIVTGLIVESAVQNGKDEDWSDEMLIVEAAPFIDIIRETVRKQDENNDGYVDQEEFAALMKSSTFQKVLGIYGISLLIGPHDMFEILDVHNVKKLSIMEVVGGLLRLRGSRESIHPLLVRDDLRKTSRKLAVDVNAARANLCADYEARVKGVQQRLSARLR